MQQIKYRALATQKEYLKYLTADLISRFGDSLDAIAYSWIMYEITGSESLMALILGLNYVPTVLLQPFTGALVDRIRKKWLMAATDACRFIIVAALAILYANGWLTPLIIAIFTLCTSTIEAFRIPAGGAMLPSLLKTEYYTIGKAASYSAARACELLGFVLAGGLIAWLGAVGVLWIDAVTFIVSALFISRIHVVEACRREKINREHIISDFKEGLSFLKSNKTIQALCVIGLVINFGLMPLSVFQTPYVNDYLQMGPEILSYIKILMILGMMSGAALAPKIVCIAKSKLDVMAGIGMGISIVLMYVTVSMENIVMTMMLLTLSMFSVGAGGGILNVINGGCMMKVVPKEMMGRLSGLNAAIMQASMPIGSCICSILVLRLSVVQVFLLFGVCTIVFYLYMWVTHKLDGLDSLENPAA